MNRTGPALSFFILLGVGLFYSATAGKAEQEFTGESGLATAATLYHPFGVAVDRAGNLYVPDRTGNRVYKVSPAGVITTVAGNGTSGYSGDGGPATAARVGFPYGVAVDTAGNLYIASSNRICKVSPGGVITTVAGTDASGYSGDGGPATQARMFSPGAVAVDRTGSVYIADSANLRIRKVDAAGIITTVAGNGTRGFSGDGGAATAASLNLSGGVAVDSAGNLFIADSDNHRIRKVNTAGTITTVAGGGPWGYLGDGGSATAASLLYPYGIAVDSAGNLYIADSKNHRIRKVDTKGIITTVAGNGTPGYSADGSPATAASLDSPWGVAVDAVGNLYIADWGNNRIRKVNTADITTTVAGNGTAGGAGAAVQWRAATEPTEPPAPKPSAEVAEILEELGVQTRRRVDRIRSENRQPNPSELSELGKMRDEFWDRALALARATGDAAGEGGILKLRCLRLTSPERLKQPGVAEEAAAACLASAAAWKRAGDGPEQIDVLTRAANALREIKPSEVEKIVAEVLEAAKTETRRPITTARILRDRAFFVSGSPERLAIAEAGLAICEKHAPGTEVVATSLSQLSLLYKETGNFDAAEEYLQRTIAILEALPPDAKKSPTFVQNLGMALNNMGVLAMERKSGAEAKAYFLRNLAREQERRPGSSGSGTTLANLATATSMEGDFTMATEYHRRRLKNLEQAKLNATSENSAPPAFQFAMVYDALAGAELRLGDAETAKDYLHRALAVLEKQQPDSRNSAETLSGLLANTFSLLASIADLEGNAQQATEYRKRSIAIREKLPSRSERDVAARLVGLAELLRANGDLVSAEAHLRRALPFFEKATPTGGELAWVLSELGWVTCERADWAAARDFFQRALAIEEQAYGPNHPEIAETLRGLAKVAEGAGAPKEALQLALRAEQTGREHLQLTAQSLPERQALLFASTRFSGQDLLLALTSGPLQQDSSAKRQVFDAFIRSRALVLDEMGNRHRAVSEAGDPEIARLARDLAAKRKLLAMLAVRGPGEDVGDRYRTQLEEYRGAKEAAERNLAAKSAQFRQEQARARVGLEEVASALPRGSALVAFVRHARDAGGLKDSPRAAHVYSAFVLRSGQSQPAMVSLGAAEEIDAAVARWREQIRQQALAKGRPAKRIEAEYRRVGDEVRKRVWDPLAAELKDATRIFAVPDGALHLVNFAALPTGETRYLIESSPPIHYLSAERDLVRFPDQEVSGRGLMAVGAPAFDEARLFASLATPGTAREKSGTMQAAAQVYRGTRSACGDFQSLRFESLPASEQELRDVVALWKKQSGQPAKTLLRGPAAPAADKGEVLLLSGVAASEAAFKENAPRRRLLHLATHGFFLGDRCPAALARAEPLQRGAAPIPAKGENSLLLAGLAFAGANHRQSAGPEEDDGILTAEEIASLNLSGVEWAVLSACDTGAGEVKAGEAVFGLRRAFQVAGARTLIMSLWSVEDQAARRWMKALYEQRFRRKQTSADAVHRATLEALRQRRSAGQSTHPFYWAAFVAAGDWR